MCDKKPYCARDIDPCLRKEISHINTFIPFAKTFASCCGHNKYPRSIFYYNIKTKEVGHGETKKTCLWLKNLPLLKPTNIVDGREQRIWKIPPSKDRWKIRSKTFFGIAQAMADQWGNE